MHGQGGSYPAMEKEGDMVAKDFLGKVLQMIPTGSREQIGQLTGIPPKTTIGSLKSVLGGIFHHGKWQMLQISHVFFFPRESVVKCLPAHH